MIDFFLIDHVFFNWRVYWCIYHADNLVVHQTAISVFSYAFFGLIMFLKLHSIFKQLKEVVFGDFIFKYWEKTKLNTNLNNLTIENKTKQKLKYWKQTKQNLSCLSGDTPRV